MKKSTESKIKITLNDLLNKTKSVIKKKNFLLILSVIIIIALASLLYYYLVLNNSKCTNEQSSPCSTETSSNNEEDTNIDNSKCVLTQEDLEFSFQDAKKEITKAIELTKQKKLKVTKTGVYSRSVIIYDPINLTYSGDIEQDMYENDTLQTTELTNVVFKDNLLIYTDQITGKEIHREEAEFKILPLDYISLNSMKDFFNYRSNVDELEWKAIVKAGDWSTIYTFVFKSQNCSYSLDCTYQGVLYHDVTITYEISSSGFLTRYDDNTDSESSDLYEIEVL